MPPIACLLHTMIDDEHEERDEEGDEEGDAGSGPSVKRRRRAAPAPPSSSAFAANGSPAGAFNGGGGARTSAVVKLFVKKVPVSYVAPWKKESQTSSTGTGFILVRG